MAGLGEPADSSINILVACLEMVAAIATLFTCRGMTRVACFSESCQSVPRTLLVSK